MRKKNKYQEQSWIRFYTVVCSILFFLFDFPISAQSQPNKRYVFILDASGSMTEKWDGKTRMAIAKEKLLQVLGGLPKDVSVGLVAYGNRIPGCSSARLYHPIQRGAASVVSQKISNIVPAGSTPIAQTLSVVGEFLLNDVQETEIIFISDGVESCDGDPKAVLYQLKNSGKKFRLQILGIDIDPQGEEDLKRLSVLGDGHYYSLKRPEDYDSSFKRIFFSSELEPTVVAGQTISNTIPSVNSQNQIKILNILPYEDGSEPGFILNYEFTGQTNTSYMIQLYLYPEEEKHRSFPIPPLRERRMGDLTKHQIEFKSGSDGKGQWIFRLPGGKRMRASAELWDLTGIPKILALSEEKPVQ
ncbi:VWA domain-containing protein [Leptospira sp. 2 VSF19]|uniref:VWA domain-containing protein n=1 Tax=Leptospira soteropolitanensis TaxID=2950025 RepID=A0AAW5VDU0_9LEPT|nr:VWA domain-containing protein [Leptospira soteropolitanensis]MCW7491719.1 VWA domain-containing protein [Leptospira soteropolitanensis]MCW7499304.1 VWA domain-containing protein [Leptospira soteropolitanensis]MCW7521105.1 VWA domain-containing protein [Leptospira soteropolitanensis]MCW7525407.1 VWA domain-containing protein [Leptospira soteropolitanensis]MCW7529274.1 VWA domain-containing protein [Leptospira soteropolitanensis]